MVILRRADVLAGLLFVAVGLAAVGMSRNYAMGSATRMGPGYFPTLLGWALASMGLVVLGKGLFKPAEAVRFGQARPLLVLLAPVAFALLVNPAGLLAATAFAVGLAAAASPQSRRGETALVILVMSLIGAVVFTRFLGLPFRLLPAWGPWSF